MPELKACPLCSTITTAPVCPNHGRGFTIFTKTHDQLFEALRNHEAGSAGVSEALAALIEAEHAKMAERMAEVTA